VSNYSYCCIQQEILLYDAECHQLSTAKFLVSYSNNNKKQLCYSATLPVLSRLGSKTEKPKVMSTDESSEDDEEELTEEEKGELCFFMYFICSGHVLSYTAIVFFMLNK